MTIDELKKLGSSIHQRWTDEALDFPKRLNATMVIPDPKGLMGLREDVWRKHVDRLTELFHEAIDAIGDTTVADDVGTFWRAGDRVVTRFWQRGAPLGTVVRAEISTEPMRQNALDDQPRTVRAEWVTIRWDDGRQEEYIASQVLHAPRVEQANKPIVVALGAFEKGVCKEVRLGDVDFFRDLTGPGMVWEGFALDTPVLVVARVQEDEWAAYVQTPGIRRYIFAVADHGTKLWEAPARELFPELHDKPYRH